MYLLTSCTPSTPNTAVNESNPQPAVVDVESPSVAEATPSNVEADTSTAEVTPANEEPPAGVFVEDGIAIRGADPVAYFTEGSYVAGSVDYTYEWGDATWQFSSAENRDLFASNPGLYAPQYGGFCAWAVSQGYTAPVDPTAWEIVDGKLYLNFDARIQRRWQQDIPGHIASADQNWPGVLSN
ncbi:MAG: YHS domain-containing protein [Leptolyngbya sp. SIO1D8]|nr:YHS domain-containing protein [Leptolyngbya sp. SIO1D8]